MELKKYKLYEIADLNKNSISNSDNTFSEIIYLDTSSITENVISATCVVATHEAPSRAQRRVEKNTILYSTVRPRLKHYGILSSPETNLIVSTGFVTIDVKSEFLNSVDARFLFLLLTQPHITAYIATIADSAVSAYPSFNPSDISALEFEFPEMNIQKHIADIWEHYDRKIGLNRQINDNLEAMSKQLYDYWFVQFDFPNKEGKPYKSSGGVMAWNEKLKREIPQGWSNGVLSDVANITMGQSPDGSSYNEDGEGIIFYQGSTDFGLRFPDIRQYTTSPSRYANKGDILMSVRAPVGALNIANNDCCIGRGLSALSSKIGSMTHLYYLMNDFRLKFEGMNSAGTTFGSITKDELFSLPVIIPTKSVISEFEQVCEPIFNKQMIIGEEINALTKQRDELLPLLMNGQASVNYHLSVFYTKR